MSLLPRSLVGRTTVLIVALLVLGQIASVVLVRELVLKPRFELLAEGFARNVSAIRAGLVSLPPAQRAAFVEQFNQRALANLPPQPEAGNSLRAALTPLERNFVRSVSRRAAQDNAQIVWRRDAGGSLEVRLLLDGTEHWIVLPGVLPAREFTGAWLAATLCSVALALIGAVLIHRHMHRPLARVVDAARTLASGAVPPVLAEDGPTEVATVSHSFNQMVRSLAQAERERALMLAGISHDLRTPLTKLRLGVEIVGDQVDPALVASMTRSVEEMDAIVGQFLDFARSDDGEPMLSTALDSIAREVAAACADHGQVLTLALGAPPAAPMRATALRRAVSNLVENAFRHGAAPVTLRTGTRERWVWLEVADSGAGIAPDHIELMKQPFRRAGDARSGPPGSGLGLAIVERIAREHGGRLELSSTAGEGLRARIWLAAGDAAA